MDGTTGPSSSQTPYLVPLDPAVHFTSILTVGDAPDRKSAPSEHAGELDRFAGIPDGIGAFDNGNGTFTVLVNHELGGTEGFVRAHGSIGAFVSELIVDKSTLAVLSHEDLIHTVYNFDPVIHDYDPAGTTAFSRFCSADLPALTALWNPETGAGYNPFSVEGGRIYLNGEEVAEGRAYAHIATGPEAGHSYELPWLGKFAHENVLANPHPGDKTLVMSTDDSSPLGQVYLYVGDKQAEGTAVERAGLSGGSLFGIQVVGPADEDRATGFGATTLNFRLADLGDVSGDSGASLQARSEAAGVTEFLRPEDGAWDPIDPHRFYFTTTDRINAGKDGGVEAAPSDGHTRLWQLTFSDLDDPTKGGTIRQLLDGSEATQMLDNLTVARDGTLILQEDTGNQAHNAKVWQYDPVTDALRLLAEHDPARFGDLGQPATAPFNQDEESSGVVDVSDILVGPSRQVFLLDVQAHYPTDRELVEGGQLLAMTIDVPLVGVTPDDHPLLT